ncbi:MAG: HAMP domain-containing protein, partial [Acidobacteria bacterium]|nr:HAMP domain-containing protein [Acidobacteriota bacterium]
MTRLQTRLILVFLAATLAPLGVTLWVTTSLLEQSLRRASTRELDAISKSLEKTAREFYQRARESLKKDVLAGRAEPQRHPLADRQRWPEPVEEFWSSGEPERFVLSGAEGDRLEYMLRREGEVAVYSTGLSGIGMARLSEQYREARELVETDTGRNWLRGFTYTYMLLAAAVWIVSLAILVYLAHRVTRPIRQLTAGLAELSAGNLGARVETDRNDEVGQAIRAFNHMAGELERSRDRLVYLTQLASWQALARKMAHEVKNSLTPIRLTMEEMLARGEKDRAFLEQASQIVVEEVESLERRVRAFSEFAAEPPVRPVTLDVNALVEERVAFLATAHPEMTYTVRLADGKLQARADEDLVKGILTNLLENAAEAAGSGGRILA